ncbi:hypothetical protein PRIPAC_72270 [Pristionchus pacificus]|uniref:RWD domain-containing protein n=1 Tax=Pristionchus pacificus TaxID=54126 RepID=A0A2A6BEI8_PRIPA|nr:hypothetical protein PRIPAC_72270 [Pristionchus pacificus]|eukprot:PDM64294.1 hypothetical protein PRIPAC_52550 [Pristionchus pacificus]
MSAKEEQDTEWEVLLSIYEGDDAFKKVSDGRLHYRVDGNKPFVLEIDWPEDYPNVPPRISLDVFFNSYICEADRIKVRDALMRVAEENQGMAVSFTLIEWAKEHAHELTSQFHEKKVEVKEEEEEKQDDRKENAMSKNAKRKMWDRVNAKGELERGHDWIDILKHLSQTRDT